LNAPVLAKNAMNASRRASCTTLIQTAKLNNTDPQAWLADVLGRIADTPQTKLAELLPWKWAAEPFHQKAA
jgi:transposase